MISKYIPGAGEEALAFLERGDYFGEMALIDNEPRSADAKAYDGGAVVLAIPARGAERHPRHQQGLVAPPAEILCNLVATRLRELDDKIIGWFILAGGAGATGSTARLAPDTARALPSSAASASSSRSIATSSSGRGDGQRRHELRDLAIGAAGQDEDAAAARGGYPGGGGAAGMQLDAPEQAAAADAGYRRQARVPAGQASLEPRCETGGARRQLLLLDHLEHRQGGGAGQRVGEEGGGVERLARGAPDPGSSSRLAEHGGDRQAAAKGLAAAQEVGPDTFGLDGEEADRSGRSR